jgi:hypothetical protein
MSDFEGWFVTRIVTNAIYLVSDFLFHHKWALGSDMS